MISDTARSRSSRLLLTSTPRNELLLVAILAVMAFVVGDFYLDLLAGFLGLALLAVSLDLVWGYAGILSFGQATFFGLGGYAIGLAEAHWDSPLAPFVGLALGILIPGVVALILGAFVFFSRVGLFFAAVITLAVSVLAEQLVNQFSDITGGFNGIILTSDVPLSVRGYYLVSVAIFAVVLLVCAMLASSDFGRVLVAIRGNEERVRFLGYSSPWVKTLAFVASGCIAGLGGVLFAVHTGLVSPSYIGLGLSTQAVIWVAVGGRGTLIGPVIGALLTNLLQHMLSGALLIYWQLGLGGALILVVLFAPDGIYTHLAAAMRRFEPKPLNRIRAASKARSLRTRRDEAVLEMRGVSKWFGSYRALSDVSIRLSPAELLCLVGPNGAGKSSLLNVITARTLASAGAVYFGGWRVSTAAPEHVARRGVARTFQASTVFDHLTVFDNLALACGGGRLGIRQLASRLSSIELPAYVINLLEAADLLSQLAEPAGTLSHGARQVLELGMVLAQEPHIVLLDEPTAGLVEDERRRIGDILRQLIQDQEISVILIEHDIEFVRRVADRIVVLDHGRIVAEGPVAEIAGSRLVREIYLGAAAQ